MHPTHECNLRRKTMTTEWMCRKEETLSSVQTKHGWSTVLIAKWCNPQLEESQSEQITENVSMIQFVALTESGLWKPRKGPYVRRDSLLTLIQQWITSAVKSSDRHDASHHTPSSVFIFFFVHWCVLIQHMIKIHIVFLHREFQVPGCLILITTKLRRRSAFHMYSEVWACGQRGLGCVQGCEVNLS